VGIEWFRDLSIAVLALETTALLILAAILVYLLNRTIRPILSRVKAVSAIAYETSTLVQEVVKLLIRGIGQGFQWLGKGLRKENGRGETDG